MSTKSYAQDVVSMSTRWAQNLHTDVIYEHRWAQNMYTDVVYWGTKWVQNEHKMLFMSTRCYLWAQKKHKKQLFFPWLLFISTKRETSE